MAYCDKCGNFDDSHLLECGIESKEYEQKEDYNWRDAEPEAECLCEICFDILNTEGKIKWKDDENPFKCASINSGTS